MRWRLAALRDRLTKGHQTNMTSTNPDVAATLGELGTAEREWMTRRRELFGAAVTPAAGLAAITLPPGIRTMDDSAAPAGLKNAPPCNIVLIYAGGDTPHPWKDTEITARPERYRWPCWVRSNPQQVSSLQDAALCIAWLERHNVPKGTCVILDLETAVAPAYVTAFNLALRDDGWKVTKYGSRNYIWKNPKTDGGTFVADPGPPHMSAVGDTVATQWGYFGGYDLSWVKDQAAVPLWDIRPPGPFRHVVPADNTQTWPQLVKSRNAEEDKLAAVTRAKLSAVNLAVFDTFLAHDAACHAAGLARPAMTPGMIWWSVNK